MQSFCTARWAGATCCALSARRRGPPQMRGQPMPRSTGALSSEGKIQGGRDATHCRCLSTGEQKLAGRAVHASCRPLWDHRQRCCAQPLAVHSWLRCCAQPPLTLVVPAGAGWCCAASAALLGPSALHAGRYPPHAHWLTMPAGAWLSTASSAASLGPPRETCLCG